MTGTRVGLLDWLFGRKRDPYDSPKRQEYRTRKSHAHGGPVPPPSGHQLLLHGLRVNFTSFRRKRSREPFPHLPDQTLPIDSTSLCHLGGTRQLPDAHYKAEKVREAGLPELPHLDALAELLCTDRNRLIWLAARPFLTDRLCAHYTLRELPKKSGGTRLLMVPLPRLKAVQRELSARLVSLLPLHSAAHGFRVRRSALTGASEHAGREVVISADISDFFPSFTFRRVAGYFRSLGYGRGVSVTLGNLMTCRLLDAAVHNKGKWRQAGFSHHAETRVRIHPELPQGAPTSPGIANAICWRMDKRLSALARKFGGDYTRYADDLTFSGGAEMSRNAGKLLHLVRRIVKTEGLALNEKKTRIMRRNRQQRVTGIVVNEKPNLSRRDFDRLKAILHNCIKHGPENQNRENHPDFQGRIRGKIAHWQHIAPARGSKLFAMYQKIVW